MIDTLENNLDKFNTTNKNSNTIICDANEIENSHILDSLSPSEKSNIHLNVKIHSDKDIENFIYLEQDTNYKSVNLILNSDFNLSKIACKKLEILVNINSILNYTDDNKLKGSSFKNYFLTTAINENENTNTLLSNDSLYTLKNFSKKTNNKITFNNKSSISDEIINFLKSRNYQTIFLEIGTNTTLPKIILEFKLNSLYSIFERINSYTNSININIENTLKFNIIHKKLLNDINNDYQNLLKSHTINTENNNNISSLYNDLCFSGYHFIMYQTLKNLNINANLVLGKNLNSNTDTYYVQVNLDKYWFNLDIVWNQKYLKDEQILRNDKEFFNTHSPVSEDLEKCTISYKKFARKYNFFRVIKNKFLILFNKNKKEVLGLPAPNNNVQKNNSIFQDF